ncbi:TIGR00725 family protein [Kineococcus xinjiangensis]|nr:TIGR00725 family protein [Kineococcus xinjiangensis]
MPGERPLVRRLQIGVVGPGDDATPHQRELAHRAGNLLARSGAVVVCGGLGGVMDAAAAGAATAGGTSIGILPDADADRASRHLTHVVCTGIGEARNFVLVNSCDAIVAVGLNPGTVVEVVHALHKAGGPVAGVDLDPAVASGTVLAGLVDCGDRVEEAVTDALRRADERVRPEPSSS